MFERGGIQLRVATSDEPQITSNDPSSSTVERRCHRGEPMSRSERLERGHRREELLVGGRDPGHASVVGEGDAPTGTDGDGHPSCSAQGPPQGQRPRGVRTFDREWGARSDRRIERFVGGRRRRRYCRSRRGTRIGRPDGSRVPDLDDGASAARGRDPCQEREADGDPARAGHPASSSHAPTTRRRVAVLRMGGDQEVRQASRTDSISSSRRP